jgi:hypothetical protein
VFFNTQTPTIGCISGDDFTKEMTIALIEQFIRADKIPFFIINNIDREFLDVNRGRLTRETIEAKIFPPHRHIFDTDAYENDDNCLLAMNCYDHFHSSIEAAIDVVQRKLKRRAIIIDLHGNAKRRLEGQVYVTSANQQASTGYTTLRDDICRHLAENGVDVYKRELSEGDAVYSGGFSLHRYGRERSEAADATQIEVHRWLRGSVEQTIVTGRRLGCALLQWYNSFDASRQNNDSRDDDNDE